MSLFKRWVLWAALAAIVLLIGMSIYGAFLGAERAQGFFNSLPLAVYWLFLAGLLVVGIVVFRRLLRVPALLLMHVGCVLVLVGAMAGSAAGHRLGRHLFGREKVRSGFMPILEGAAEDRVGTADSNDYLTLPFSVRLVDFRIEYYQVGTLYVEDAGGRNWTVAAEPGNTLDLGDDWGSVTVLRVFQNFRLDIVGEEPVAFDAPGGSNPALQVEVARPDGTTTRRYVFEDFGGHSPENRLAMSYYRSVRDFVSELEIVTDGAVVASKDVEVNHPLHYGGYHFYQHEYGENQWGRYTVLRVVSDSGLKVVWAGYAMLIAGVCWHFWGRRVWSVARRLRITPAAEVEV